MWNQELKMGTRLLRREVFVFVVLIMLVGLYHVSAKKESALKAATGESGASSVIMKPEDADNLWVFAKSKDELGSGGEFHIYLDSEKHPEAKAAFAKFALGVEGALPEHKHEKTEEIAYFLSGEGIVQIYENGNPKEVPVHAGYVWYTPSGAWHSLKNTGKEPLTLVFATIPNEKKGLLSFFRRIGARPGHEPTPLSQEEFATVAAAHDLILKPPSKVE